jgi:tetratricopeptide (TPR) repeat protein
VVALWNWAYIAPQQPTHFSRDSTPAKFDLAKSPPVVGDYRTVEQALEGTRTRSAILALAVCLFVLLCYQSGKLWLADHDIRSNTLQQLERGAALEPDNADAWDALGRFRQLDFSNPDPAGALADYQRAVRVNPLSAHHWMNLAGAYEANGDIQQARNAFQSARSAYPLSAEVAWNYGNFLLRQGENEEGYAEIQHAVRSDPKLLTLAISRTWRSSRDVNVLLDQVLPVEPGAYLLALDYFASTKQMDPAQVVWRRLVETGKPIVLAKSFPFLDELITEDRSADALKVWTDALAMAGLNYEAPLRHSLIWNGDFGQDFVGGGLGWRWHTPIGVEFAFDTVPQTYGVRSAQFVFGGGNNLELTEPAQFVAVVPNQMYRFHAYMRTESIATEMGMSFSIIDPNHVGAVNVRTENLTGSHPWTTADMDVVTSPQTHFLLVRLVRPASRMFDNKLSGTAWIADVSLIPSEPPVVNESEARTR